MTRRITLRSNPPVRRDGVAKGQCIRVSPALYTTEDEVHRFVAALAAETSKG